MFFTHLVLQGIQKLHSLVVVGVTFKTSVISILLWLAGINSIIISLSVKSMSPTNTISVLAALYVARGVWCRG